MLCEHMYLYHVLLLSYTLYHQVLLNYIFTVYQTQSLVLAARTIEAVRFKRVVGFDIVNILYCMIV